LDSASFIVYLNLTMLYNFYWGAGYPLGQQTIADVNKGCMMAIVSKCNPNSPHDHKNVCELLSECLGDCDYPCKRKPYQIDNPWMVEWINQWKGCPNGIFVSDGKGKLRCIETPVVPVSEDIYVAATPGDIHPDYLVKKLVGLEKEYYSTYVVDKGSYLEISMDYPHNIFTDLTNWNNLMTCSPYGMLKISSSGALSIDCNVPDWIGIEALIPPIEDNLKKAANQQKVNQAKIDELKQKIDDLQDLINEKLKILNFISEPNVATAIAHNYHTVNVPAGTTYDNPILYYVAETIGSHHEYPWVCQTNEKVRYLSMGAVNSCYIIMEDGVYLITMTGWLRAISASWWQCCKSMGTYFLADTNRQDQFISSAPAQLGYPIHHLAVNGERNIPLTYSFSDYGASAFWVGQLTKGSKVTLHMKFDNNISGLWAQTPVIISNPSTNAAVTLWYQKYLQPAVSLSITQIFKSWGQS